MNYTEIIGYAATAILGVAFIPQTIHVWRSKSVEDISLKTYSMLVVAGFLWLVYGYLKNDWPIMLVNSMLLISYGAIVICKLKYGKKS